MNSLAAPVGCVGSIGSSFLKGSNNSLDNASAKITVPIGRSRAPIPRSVLENRTPPARKQEPGVEKKRELERLFKTTTEREASEVPVVPAEEKLERETGATVLHALVLENETQASMIPAALSANAANAVPKNSESLLRPLPVKRSNRAKKFGTSLQRLWSSRNSVAVIANAAESVLTLLEPVTQPWYADTEIQLEGNFAPVEAECPPTSGLEVTGTIPECMNGVYVRNGSNPQIMPSGGYHVFDGDGMLHAVRIKDGVPSYCCRFTRTNRYNQEKTAGQTLYPFALGELNGLVGLARLGLFYMRNQLGLLDKSKGIGTANAGLAFFDGKLLAMSEDDMPYAVEVSVEDGDLRTLGRLKIAGADEATSTCMTAHPKVDPVTGEMFSYTYNVLEKPYVKYWRTSKEGKMQPPVAIPVPDPVLVHDFAVTEKYAIIPDPAMVFKLSELLAGKSAIVMDEEKVSRLGVLPKYAASASAMKWFDFPGVNCMHYTNAWEEGDEVVIVGSNSTPPSRMFNDPTGLYCYLTEFRMNLKTGKASERRVSDWNLDVGRMNERFSGRKSRYVYMAAAGPWPRFSGIVKLDLQAGGGAAAEVGVRRFPPGCYCSEPCFVPRTQGPGADDAESEDDGYIVTYLHNERTNVSELGIFDARSPTLEPVATVKLPARVPYGFHGIFLTEEELRNQKSSPTEFGL